MLPIVSVDLVCAKPRASWYLLDRSPKTFPSFDNACQRGVRSVARETCIIEELTGTDRPEISTTPPSVTLVSRAER